MEPKLIDENTTDTTERSRLFTTTTEYVTKAKEARSSCETYQLLLISSPGLRLRSKCKVVLIGEPCLLVLPPLFSYSWMLPGDNTYAIPMIVFDDWLLDQVFALKYSFSLVRRLLSQSVQGLVFTGTGFEESRQRFLNIFDQRIYTFEEDLSFLSLLLFLSHCPSHKFMQDTCPVRDENENEGHTSRLEKVCVHIRTNYGNRISQKEVAELAHMSVPAFSVFFSKSLGCNLTEYLNRLRIKHACNMLMMTDEKIITVAYRCGFQTLSHFSEQFKRRIKMSPTEYRDKSRR